MKWLDQLRAKLNKAVFTLRFSLLSIFISLFVVTLISLFSVFYFHIDYLVNRAAFLLVDADSLRIITDLNVQLYPLENTSKLTAELIESGVLNINDPQETEIYLFDLLRKSPLVNGVYWGDVKGNFTYARREDDGSITTEIINRDVYPPTQFFVYRNKDDKIIKKVSMKPDFDPRVRVWYKLATERKNTVWTDVYVYSQGPANLGIAIASPAYHKDGSLWGVYSMDVRLDYLSRYVAARKIAHHGEVFIVDDKGELLASPKLIQMNPETYYKKGLMNLYTLSKSYGDAFKTFKNTKQKVFLFKSDHQKYIAAFNKIPSLLEHGWYIAIVDPESDFTSNIQKLKFVYLIFDSLIFILGILLISKLVNLIVTPIKKLEIETEYIKNFNLEPRPRILSRIKEVIELSSALHAMKNGLRSFQRYVPASLVRQLIEVGDDARIGGAKRDMVVFFSDIKDFTSISERTDSNQLVQQVCNYFDAFARIINEQKGTIDKYIGDSVMAFWGAPLPVYHACERAARAALTCKQRGYELNIMWKIEEKPLLSTRFGLHYGEAIVGNIGSSERLNYTVVGDMVNVTSRLVSANKIYGTDILVSDAIYQQIKDMFVLRFVDNVMLKGKAQALAIYELLAESKQSILFDIEKYQAAFSEAYSLYQQQQWRLAITRFNDCLQIYPQDALANTFIVRCEYFISNPPDMWDGVWRLSEK